MTTVLLSIIISRDKLARVRESISSIIGKLPSATTLDHGQIDNLINEAQSVRAIFNDLGTSTSIRPEVVSDVIKNGSYFADDIVSFLQVLRYTQRIPRFYWLRSRLSWKAARNASRGHFLGEQRNLKQRELELDRSIIKVLQNPRNPFESTLYEALLQYNALQIEARYSDDLTGSSTALQSSHKSQTSISQQSRQLQPAMTKFPRLTNLRRPDEHGFYGRAPELESLNKVLDSHNPSNQAIVGLGGLGKTSLARHLAHGFKNRNREASVLWITASTETEFERCLSYIFTPEILGSAFAHNTKDNFELLREFFSSLQSGDWLLVVDGVDNEDVLQGQRNLRQYLPKSPRGSILFTSRNKSLIHGHVESQNIIELGNLPPEYSLQLLNELCPSTRADVASSEALLSVLFHVPEAIVLASAFMKSQGKTADEYISLHKVLKTNAPIFMPVSSQELTSVINATWLVSFTSIQQEDALAIRILSFMACIDSKSIAERIMPSFSKKKEMSNSLDTLKSYSMITWDKDSQTYNLHGLVRLATRSRLAAESRLLDDIRSAYNRIYELFPRSSDGRGDFEAGRDLLAHAETILCENELSVFPKTEDLVPSLLRLVHIFCSMSGHYPLALRFARMIYGETISCSGKDSGSSALAQEQVAISLIDCGQFAQAESELKEVIRVQELVQADPLQLLESRHQLGRDLYLQGRAFEAETILREVWEARERVLGDRNNDTTKTLNNLALSLQRQGKNEEAELLFRRMVELRTKDLGENDPNTLTSLSNLGTVLQTLRKWDEALLFHVQAFNGRKDKLGPDHPETLKSHANIAAVMQEQGRHNEAEILLRDISQRQADMLGESHPDVLTMNYNIAVMLHAQGKLKEAEALSREVYKRRQLALGDDHPDTVASQAYTDGLAAWLRSQEDEDEDDVE